MARHTNNAEATRYADHRPIELDEEQPLAIGELHAPRILRCRTITCCRSAAFSAQDSSWTWKGKPSRFSKSSRSAIITADGKRFCHQIKQDEVLSTHSSFAA